MSELIERPLVSFVIFAYNQEKYIREAVNGAFSQTYEPLEIILSDDFSSDQTFEIIQEMVNGYNGKHLIKINKTNKNLGLAGHINNVIELCSSDFVVFAAGDDISLPERTSFLANAWVNSNATLIFSSASAIAENSSYLNYRIANDLNMNKLNNRKYLAAHNYSAWGATSAYDIRLFADFSNIMESVIFEDQILSARSILVGKTEYINKDLVKYRANVGVGGISQRLAKSGDLSDSHIPLHVKKRDYISFVQKYSDYKSVNFKSDEKNILKKSRANTLFRVWLINGSRQKSKILYFAKRADLFSILNDLIKYLFPRVLHYKRLIQFKINTLSNNLFTK